MKSVINASCTSRTCPIVVIVVGRGVNESLGDLEYMGMGPVGMGMA